MTHEVVLLSYNAIEELARALAALKQWTRPETPLVVIDNASEAPTVDWLKRQQGIQFVLNAENKKYTRGYAEYLETSKGDVVTLMNNDCFPEPGWELPLLDLFARYPRAALVGPLLVDEGGGQVVHAGGGPDFASHYVGQRGMHFTREEPRCWMTGACISLRMSAYRELGGFDRSLEHYCSDSDFCLRAWLAGWQVWLQPASIVRHTAGVSTRWVAHRDPQQYRKLWDDQARFQQKWDKHGIRLGEPQALFQQHAALCTRPTVDPLTAGV